MIDAERWNGGRMKPDPLTKLCPTCKLPLSQHQVKCACQKKEK